MSNASRRERKRITVAIAAMGGQGGGVLADWLVALGEANGYIAQTTSVPGVAQRTGATIYYLELFPKSERYPVLALMPVPGDVDVVLAAELVEAARAVQRGIVTKDRTTLIASSHRQYSLDEKAALGDGRKSPAEIRRAIKSTAKQLICFDMQTLAEAHGTVISATLFGALAGSGVLPFSADHFEAAISASGKAVEANLAAFRAACERAISGEQAPNPSSVPTTNGDRHRVDGKSSRLRRRIEEEFPTSMNPLLVAGVRRLVDYQDFDYAAEYLDKVLTIVRAEQDSNAHALSAAVARHLALWMSYEDTIRVADLKIRADRFERCRVEVRASEKEIVELTEFMHPRIQEVADTLPAAIGQFLLGQSWLSRTFTAMFLGERKVKTSHITGFMMLYVIASCRKFRRRTLRFQVEHRRIDEWLALIDSQRENDYALALEITKCQNLIKGYGDTHERGLKKYRKIVDLVRKQHERVELASIVQELREAALADEAGEALESKLKTVA